MLDLGREWFFNNETGVLYYKPNVTVGAEAAAEAYGGAKAAKQTKKTGASDHAQARRRPRAPPTGTFVATQPPVLLNLSGSREAPVRGVSVRGLVLRDTSYSYFAAHGLPSGGDWALAKQGAITIAGGSEGVSVEHCLLTRLDGNAIFVGGYARNLSLSHNEFEFIGENAMASWGDTSTNLNANEHSRPPNKWWVI